MNKKRLFFAFEVTAPWPPLPNNGRLLPEPSRHLTLAFLGETDWEKMTHSLAHLPAPPFKVGFVGHFDKCLFLPSTHPHVVAWRVDWLEESHLIEHYQHRLSAWIKEQSLPIDAKDSFLPHVTVARQPTDTHIWMNSFSNLPLAVKHIHLYESLGNLQYIPRWTYQLHDPFEEIEHTADIAYIVRGETLTQIYQHARVALAFKFPSFLEYSNFDGQPNHLDDVIIALNEAIAKADAAVGCPFKAVSFHGEIIEEPDHTLKWEMIIDV